MADMDDCKLDGILGITRCARCGHRLDGQVDCPFCAVVEHTPKYAPRLDWVYIMACFLTSPLSIYSVVTTDRLSIPQKVFALSGCLFWAAMYMLILR